MALIKTKMTDFGIEANYWKITMVSIDRNMLEGSFSLSLYLNKDAKNFIESYTVSLNEYADKQPYHQCFERLDINVYKACYEFANKYVEYFKDAINDNLE